MDTECARRAGPGTRQELATPYGGAVFRVVLETPEFGDNACDGSGALNGEYFGGSAQSSHPTGGEPLDDEDHRFAHATGDNLDKHPVVTVVA